MRSRMPERLCSGGGAEGQVGREVAAWLAEAKRLAIWVECCDVGIRIGLGGEPGCGGWLEEGDKHSVGVGR